MSLLYSSNMSISTSTTLFLLMRYLHTILPILCCCNALPFCCPKLFSYLLRFSLIFHALRNVTFQLLFQNGTQNTYRYMNLKLLLLVPGKYMWCTTECLTIFPNEHQYLVCSMQYAFAASCLNVSLIDDY